MFKEKNFKLLYIPLFLIFIFSLIALFTRSIVGVSIFSFRIGEWLILISLFLSLLGSILYFKIYEFAKFHLLLIFSFFSFVNFCF